MPRSALTRDEAALVTAGAALMLIQYLAARELSSTLFSCELVVFGTTLCTLLGPSLGYALSRRLRGSPWLLAWAGLALSLQLALPVGIRAFVALCCGYSQSSLPVALLLGGALVGLCGFYAVLLPLRAAPLGLSRLYACELAGALLALALIRLVPSWRAVVGLYYAVIALAAALLLPHRLATAAAAVPALLAAALYPRLDAAAAQTFYQRCRGYTAPALVSVDYSPYQRVDVVEDRPAGAAPRRRALYLDGVPHFQSGELTLFPHLLAELPARLQPARGPALVIGSGSFSSAGQLHRLGYAVTVVELDAAVARAGFAAFAAAHALQPGQVQVVIDDVRHYLARRADRYQMIVLDVPAPYHLQTALLHTPAFYQQVAAHLLPGGVVALSLCDELEGELGSSIAASAGRAFDEVRVLESESLGFAVLYAAAGALPFSEAATAEALGRYDARGGRLYGDAATRLAAYPAEPLSAANLRGVLTLAGHTLPTLRIWSE